MFPSNAGKNVQFQQTKLFLSCIIYFFDYSPVVSSLLKRRIVNHHPDEKVPDPRIRILLHHIQEVVEILKPTLQPYIVNQALQGSQSKIYNIHSPTFFLQNYKKNLLSTPNLNYWKREIIKISWFLNGSSSLRIKISEKISEKIRQKIWKFCFV